MILRQTQFGKLITLFGGKMTDLIDIMVKFAKENSKKKPKMAKRFKVNCLKNKELQNEKTKN